MYSIYMELTAKAPAPYTSTSRNIRQHTSAYVRIRQHPSGTDHQGANARQFNFAKHETERRHDEQIRWRSLLPAYVSIRQHM